ncbi:MAG TPA: lipoxygenase family protein [Gemmataceae bacterium]|jgi:arachidonate 15-lipoxygenase|nr:lipoxygenase family protein [Gemmataceae bacterium]
MTAFLPHQDPNPKLRERRLRRCRRRYRFNHAHVSPLAIIDRVPARERFGFGWLQHVARQVRTVIRNRMLLEGDSRSAVQLEKQYRLLTRILQTQAVYFASALQHFVYEALVFRPRVETVRRPEILEEYATLFRAIGLPPVRDDLHDDRTFAWLRIAGPNPLTLRRIARPDKRFAVTEADFRQALPDDSLEAAGAEGRLFLADFAALADVEPGDFPCGQKYLYAPLALFAVHRVSRELLPVAIQCSQTPGPEAPVFTPADGYNWLIAKTIVEIADANLHEAVSHLARTHLLMEPFVIATHRELARMHPLNRLLVPHFRGTLAINEAAWRRLIADGGAVDRVLAGRIESTRQLSANGVCQFHFRNGMLPKALAAADVNERDSLADYPYRDDAMLHWKAIWQWISDYLAIYYPTDATVQEDAELQSWLREIASPDSGRLHGIGPEDGQSVAGLTDILTMVVFTCSVQHAAVNFPQYDIMSYAPRMPFAAYTPAPKSKTGATEADYLAMLPPLNIAEQQMEIGYLLGSVHYTTLGAYGAKHFTDPRVQESLRAFQARLEDIARTIEERNLTRRPYTCLTPGGVPQSINI